MDSHIVQANSAVKANPFCVFLDLKESFEVWLGELRPAPPLSVDHDPVDFVVECDFGSDCEIRFEGVLQLEGCLSGSIRSQSGTLVTGPGSINADIEVGTAIINSSGSFNIRASERVLVRGNVRVSGNIRANFLAIREGAIFEGDCSILADPASAGEPAQLQPNGAPRRAMTACANGD